MIASKCPFCGHEVEVSPADQERGFPCSNCGRFLSSSSMNAQAHQATPAPQSSSNDATIAGPTTGVPTGTFPFLSPPTGPGELGWMAHYKVTRLLGQGGMGAVFEAVDTHLQRTVALKVMKPDIAQDASARERFLREARATAAVKSDNIVTIYQVSTHNDVPFIAMEFLKGESLDTWLLRRGRPSLEEALRIGAGLANGLAAAHELGLIHRDIKPSNVWLEEPQARAKILDFGLARDEKANSNLTNTGMILGTPAYMAPEQAEHGKADARADLFSLGCVLYELTTGRQAFVGASVIAILKAVAMHDPTPPINVHADVPPELSRLTMQLLAKNPLDRPLNAPDVVATLESVAAAAGVCTLAPTSGVRPQPTSGIRPQPAPITQAVASPGRPMGLLIGVAVVVLLIAVGLIGWQIFGRQSSTGPLVNAAARATAPGVTHDEILLGMTGPFTGPAGELGREMEIGLETYFAQINEQGGVHGRSIKLVALDDGYDADRALANIVELREKRKVFAFIGSVGSGLTGKTVTYSVDNKFLYFGPFSGAKILRKVPPDRYVFNYRASYEEETEQIARYLVKTRKFEPSQIAVFAQNDGLGDEGYRGVAKALAGLERHDVKVLRVGYERNSVQVQDAVDTILKNPDIRAVVMIATYRPATVFIQKLKDAKRDLVFANISFVGSMALSDGLKELGPTYADGVIVSQVVPSIDSSATAILNYREALKKQHPQARPTFISLEGYLSATLFVEGLKKAGDQLTTESLVDALESIRDFDVGIGAPLTFGPSVHQASRKVWGTQLDKEGRFQVLELE